MKKWQRVLMNLVWMLVLGGVAFYVVRLIMDQLVASQEKALVVKKPGAVKKRYSIILSNGHCWVGLDKNVSTYDDYGVSGARFCAKGIGDVYIGRALTVITVKTDKKNLRAIVMAVAPLLKGACWPIIARGWGRCP